MIVGAGILDIPTDSGAYERDVSIREAAYASNGKSQHWSQMNNYYLGYMTNTTEEWVGSLKVKIQVVSPIQKLEMATKYQESNRICTESTVDSVLDKIRGNRRHLRWELWQR